MQAQRVRVEVGRTSNVEAEVERVARVGLLIRRAVAVGVALEGAQELVALNLLPGQPKSA